MHGEVDPRLLLLAEREVVVDRGAVEAREEEILEPVPELGVESVARQRDEDRDAALLDVGPDEELCVLAFLEVEEGDELLAQLLGARDEELVLRERLEQLDERLVVVGALEEVLGDRDLAELAAQDRDPAGRRHVGLAREDPDDAKRADRRCRPARPA